jgi:hypothetical protein
MRQSSKRIPDGAERAKNPLLHNQDHCVRQVLMACNLHSVHLAACGDACDADHSLRSIWSAMSDSFKGRFQVMHTQRQHWLDYDPVALAILIFGIIGLLALVI